MTDAPLRLGIDLGTSAVKAAVLDESSEAVATARPPFPPSRTARPGRAGTAPLARGRRRGRGGIGRQLGGDWQSRIAAIGLAGQLPTLVCLGAEGAAGSRDHLERRPRRRLGGRSADDARRAALYRRTGMPIDGRYLGPMYRFHWHDRRAGIRRILSAKDYLCHALTGARRPIPRPRRAMASSPWTAPRSRALRPLGSRSGPAAGTAAAG